MKEYVPPKVIEKTPIVLGYRVDVIVVCIVCVFAFGFTVSINFFVSLIFLIFGGGYFFIFLKFPRKGELMQFINYTTGSHCIKINQPIKTLIKTNTHTENKNN